MNLARLRAALRFDSGGWRRFAELGCVWGPEWWKRGSPPAIAAIVFAIARQQPRTVLRHERNPSVRRFMHQLRTRHGIRLISSGASVFAALPVLEALRRHEVVGMQIDPWGGAQGSHALDFCGAPARFQLGPFAIARVARAP